MGSFLYRLMFNIKPFQEYTIRQKLLFGPYTFDSANSAFTVSSVYKSQPRQLKRCFKFSYEKKCRIKSCILQVL